MHATSNSLYRRRHNLSERDVEEKLAGAVSGSVSDQSRLASSIPRQSGPLPRKKSFADLTIGRCEAMQKRRPSYPQSKLPARSPEQDELSYCAVCFVFSYGLLLLIDRLMTTMQTAVS